MTKPTQLNEQALDIVLPPSIFMGKAHFNLPTLESYM